MRKKNARNCSKRRSSRERNHEKKKKKTDDNSHASEIFDVCVLNKEDEQKRLELEMQKRREIIERWWVEQKKKEQITKREANHGTLVAELTIPTGMLKSDHWKTTTDGEEAGKDGE